MASTDVAHRQAQGASLEQALPVALHLPVGVAPKPLQSGKIRGGEKSGEDGKGAPRALKTLRMTHPVREVIEAAAAVYGGTAKEWNDPKARPAKQWEVITTSNSIDVIVATEGSFTCVYESWTEAGVSMRTDGRVNLITGELLADPCPPDDAQGWAARHGLKLTTRFTVMPQDLPGLSEWMFETHGWITTATLAETFQKLAHFANAGISHVPARLTLTPAQGQVPMRTAGDIAKAEKAPKSHGYRKMADGAWVQKSNFVLAGLEIVTQTPRELFALASATATRVGEIETQRLELERAEEADATEFQRRQLLAKRPKIDRDDPHAYDDDDAEFVTVQVAAGKTALVAAYQAAGFDQGGARDAAKAAWDAARLPARGSVQQLRVDELVAAVLPPVEDDTPDAEIVPTPAQDNPFAIDTEEGA